MNLELNKKYLTRCGDVVRIICVDAPGPRNIIGLLSDGGCTWYLCSGRCYETMNSTNDIMVEYTGFENIPKDAKVEVCINGAWIPAHFCDIEQGIPRVYRNGRTSWTAKECDVFYINKLENLRVVNEH